MCEGSDLISDGTTHGCSTMTMRQPMLPSWRDGFWPITTWLWCHILPTRPTLHPVTFYYFQNWKWSLRGEDFRRWRKFKQSRRPSWTRYEKMTSKNISKTGSAAGIVVKPQKGTTLKVMPAPSVNGKLFCVLSHQSGNLLTTPRIIHIKSEVCHASGLVLNLTPCSIHKRKPITRNEIFPDDLHFVYTKNGRMTADFMGEWKGRGTFGNDALQLHVTHKEC